MKIINPINYAKSAYRSTMHTGKIKPRCYTEGYFMQKSPLTKDYIQKSKGNFITRMASALINYFSK